MKVILNIFNLDGRVIRSFTTDLLSTGYSLPPIIWDGNDERGRRAGKGIYPYSVIVTTGSGETARVSGRMIIL